MQTSTSHKDVSIITRTGGCIPRNKARNGANIFHQANEALTTMTPRDNSRYAPGPLIIFQYVFTTCTTPHLARFTIVPISHATISTASPISHTLTTMATL